MPISIFHYITLVICGKIVMLIWKIILGIVLILACLAVSDSRASIADTSIPDNEVTSSEANNSSATATITITMTTLPDE